MNKQNIEKEISFKKELILEKLKQKHTILKSISSYEEDIFELEKQLKECDVLKLKDGYVFGLTDIYHISELSIWLLQGRCYPTEELAEIAFNNSNIRNRLEAYSREVDTKWREGVYKDNDWYIYLDDNGECFANNNSMKRLGEVRMSEKAARRIAKRINEKEITL